MEPAKDAGFFMRYWFLDGMKGIAILLVILFHLLFDAQYFMGAAIDTDGFLVKTVGMVAACSFIFISGVCFALANQQESFVKVLRRSAYLALFAAAISLFTYLILPAHFILFGILHFLAVAPLIAYLVIESSRATLAMSILVFGASFFLPFIWTESAHFIWLGITPEWFSSFDYFPLIPWLSLYLLGAFVGQTCFPVTVKDLSHLWPIKGLIFLGQRTLFLYLVHQPVAMILFYLGHLCFSLPWYL